MFFSIHKMRFVARTLSAALIWCGLQSSIAHASFVSTEALNQASVSSTSDSHEALRQVLAREDVRTQLIAHGVSPEAAQARIAALTDAEARQLADQFASLPAGGDALGIIILVLLVLVLTDLLGVTDVFPGIRPAI